MSKSIDLYQEVRADLVHETREVLELAEEEHIVDREAADAFDLFDENFLYREIETIDRWPKCNRFNSLVTQEIGVRVHNAPSSR